MIRLIGLSYGVVASRFLIVLFWLLENPCVPLIELGSPKYPGSIITKNEDKAKGKFIFISF